MRVPLYTTQFRKDIKKQRKRGKNIEKLKHVATLLIEEKTLPSQNKDHTLVGNWINCRECHLEPDWLLIYKIHDSEIYFVRTGSHSDLFK